ncbi:MAG: hypothetical protein Q8N75_14210 [Pseudomonadota bacterium]|nr:hypothetical protein [Pseudomonadota bacterium]
MGGLHPGYLETLVLRAIHVSGKHGHNPAGIRKSELARPRPRHQCQDITDDKNADGAEDAGQMTPQRGLNRCRKNAQIHIEAPSSSRYRQKY